MLFKKYAVKKSQQEGVYRVPQLLDIKYSKRIAEFLSKLDYINQKSKLYILRTLNYNGQVITKNFTKVTKYLTKLKETNYVWEKSHVKKK